MGYQIKKTIFYLFCAALLSHSISSQAASKKKTIKNKDIVQEIKELQLNTERNLALSTGLNAIIFLFIILHMKKNQKRNDTTVDWMLSETKSTLYHQHRQLKKQLKSQQEVLDKLLLGSPHSISTHPKQQASDTQNTPVQIDQNLLVD